ncbi:hypothetical protein D8674_042022 [Pyrus ussuriensis x Pyrus communis]|uniref:Myb-like domain-containing protein n=1 Tax=Pyrus ussuriensis x Pyrus communis TaxID=2448454 RepID=A0A5N5GEY5_9ROSA|nr:hypothetical protein D8674_042022 [Pyrus ussuriensis x Pyrus communis]
MATSAMKDRAWTQKEDEALCRAYRWVSEDSVRGRSQTSEDPPQQRVGPTPVFGHASSTADGDEDRYLTIQETRVENPSPGEGSIPRATGRNKARKLKEKGKAKDDYAFQ